MATLPPSSEPDSQTPATDRLDSWKEIASYLKREIRTVQRWEESEGLPIHRHLHRKQGSVYAFKSELDAWWKNHTPPNGNPPDPADPLTELTLDDVIPRADTSPLAIQETAPSDGSASHALSQSPATPRDRPQTLFTPRNAIYSASALALILIFVFVARRAWSDSPAHRLADVALSDGRLIALHADGTIAWDYFFSRAPLLKKASMIVPEKICGSGTPSILAAFDWGGEDDDEVDCFTQSGARKWTFKLSDSYQFGSDHFGPPWRESNWGMVQHAEGPELAIAFHHDLWWPGVLVFLNSRGQPTHRFVNSGWILQVRSEETSSGTVLLASGVTNSRNAAFIAALDPNSPDGTSPEDPGSEFECKNCPSGHPLKYWVFPRSEVSVATGAPDDESGIQEIAGDIIFRTYETQLGGPYRPAEAIYKVSRNLEILSATYGDAYWDVHRQLEVSGVITHDRAHCPNRNGPPLVREWDPQNGWRDIHLNSVAGH
ncbi:MAG TPA: hypothetical protein VFO34_05620 [Candidatus Acidoferrales bacterium]|nr:hypothetical protein [Candidatus Acidoferrales bacterium]